MQALRSHPAASQPILTALVTACLLLTSVLAAARASASDYAELVALFGEWRDVEQPRLLFGAPDYTPAAVQERFDAMRTLRERLYGLDTSDWPVEQKVDWHLVRAEMNGLDFYVRVLQPWAKDPTFYASIRTAQSDTPAEEAPTIHNPVRLWQYAIWPRTALDEPAPLPAEAEARLAWELRTVKPLLEQARGNLTGNGRDLWVPSSIAFANQERALATLGERLAEAGDDVRAAQREALAATTAFREWLEVEAPKKTGASGVTRDEYTWHLRNVLLVNSTWEGEVQLMQREMARGYAGLKMEEARNASLPPLEPAGSAENFAALQARSITNYMQFMQDRNILTVEPWMDRALRERVFPYSPPAERNFFGQATHRDPRTLWTHFFHYWDLARFAEAPAPFAATRCATTCG